MNHFISCMICSLICGVLFFALTPGVILTLPPKCSGKVFIAMKDKNSSCCSTSYAAAGVHSLVFALLIFLICLLTKKKTM